MKEFTLPGSEAARARYAVASDLADAIVDIHRTEGVEIGDRDILARRLVAHGWPAGQVADLIDDARLRAAGKLQLRELLSKGADAVGAVVLFVGMACAWIAATTAFANAAEQAPALVATTEGVTVSYFFGVLTGFVVAFGAFLFTAKPPRGVRPDDEVRS